MNSQHFRIVLLSVLFLITSCTNNQIEDSTETNFQETTYNQVELRSGDSWLTNYFNYLDGQANGSDSDNSYSPEQVIQGIVGLYNNLNTYQNENSAQILTKHELVPDYSNSKWELDLLNRFHEILENELSKENHPFQMEIVPHWSFQ